MPASLLGLSPSLPLRVDEVDGPYALNKTIKQMAKQNLRVLFFTSPGERIWNIKFGVGLRRFLFEQNTAGTERAIKVRITNQINTYMPYIKIAGLDFLSARNVPELNEGALLIKLSYVISPHGVADTIFLNAGAPVSAPSHATIFEVP